MARLLIYGKGGRQILLCLTNKRHTPKGPPLKHNSKTLCEHLLWLFIRHGTLYDKQFPGFMSPRHYREASVPEHLLRQLRDN